MPPMPPTKPPMPPMRADGGTDPDDENNLEIECTHCGYIWTYTGKMWKATCPRCGRKTPTPYDPDYESDDDS